MEIYIKLFEVLFPVFFIIGTGYFLGKKSAPTFIWARYSSSLKVESFPFAFLKDFPLFSIITSKLKAVSETVSSEKPFL